VAEHGIALGIDLGGTSVKVGVVNRAGEILSRGVRPTEVEKGPSGVAENIALAVEDALQAAGMQLSGLDGVGVGTPGICDAARGVVVSSGNLNWKNVPLADLLQRRLGVPVRLENDANCAGLGEQWCGAARGHDHVILYTLGTGVGGALILGGRIYGGATGWAGELGHIRVAPGGPACTCGLQGCLEAVSSATAMAREGREAVAAGRSPAMARLAAEQGGRLDARVVITAAREGDPAAQQILRQAGEYLGIVSAMLVSALNPELIVVGGGASHAGDFLLEPMRRVIAEQAMPGPASIVRVVQASLGNDAGLIGAATLIWRWAVQNRGRS
jgi:glucokinase